MEVVNIYKYFIAEVKKQLSLKGWKYADLAKATGYSIESINRLTSGQRAGEKLINTVAKVLDIER